MADFHFCVKQLKRSDGQSAISSAAYQSCQKLHSEYYDEINDYSKKSGLIISEINLPSHVPREYKNREYLWNDVEKTEKRKDSQLAYKFDFSLMNEFSIEENIKIARQFIQENFVSRGMICDWAFHLPKKEDDKNQNPHIHLMCPIRPMNEDGTWGSKQKNIPLFDINGEPVLNEKGKQKYNSIKTTDWSEPETLIEWRRNWAKINNEMFKRKGINKQISAESYETQGLDLIPTIHEGVAVREMEKKGIITEKGEFNRWVRCTNEIIKLIRFCFKDIYEWIQNLKGTPLQNRNLYRFLGCYYVEQKRKLNPKDFDSQYRDFWNSIMYVKKNNISSINDLERIIIDKEKSVNSYSPKRNEIRERITELNQMKNILAMYYSTKDIATKYEKKFLGKDKFYSDHKTEIDKYYYCKKRIPTNLISNPDWEIEINNTIRSLQKKVEDYNAKLKPIKADLDELYKLRKCIDIARGNTKIVEKEKAKDMAKVKEKVNERQSLLSALEKAKVEAKQYNESRTKQNYRKKNEYERD